jgi:hypothetical protein
LSAPNKPIRYLTTAGTYHAKDGAPIRPGRAEKFAADLLALADLHGLRFAGRVAIAGGELVHPKPPAQPAVVEPVLSRVGD